MDVLYISLGFFCLLGNVHSYNKEILDLYMHKMTGQANYYDSKSGGGSCQLGPELPPIAVSHQIKHFVGVSSRHFAGSRTCGMCLRVKGTGEGFGSNPVEGEFLVLVNDLCPGCAEGYLDIGADGNGQWGVEIQAVQCPVEESNIEYRMHGSSEWYIRLQIRNTRVPVQSVFVIRNEKLLEMSHTSDGFWELGDGKFTVPLYIKMVGVTDEPIYDIIGSIENDVVQKGVKGAQFTLDPNLPQ